MPYKNKNSSAAKASNRRKQMKWRKTKAYEKSRREGAWKRYGIVGFTWEKYEQLLEKQQHKCAIIGCNWLNKRKLCVDHDHKTGKVRGLLCITHNRIAGEIENGSVGAVEAYLARG